MQEISKAAKQASEDVQLLVARETATKEKWTLRAVVPGRAWLVNPAGETMSISKGTVISNYGTVKDIDSDNGKILMSSGYVFD